MNQTEDSPSLSICLIGCSIRPALEELFLEAHNRPNHQRFSVIHCFDYFQDLDSSFFSTNIPFTKLTAGNENQSISNFLSHRRQIAKQNGEKIEPLSWILLGGADTQVSLIEFLEDQSQTVFGPNSQTVAITKNPDHWTNIFSKVFKTVPRYSTDRRCPPGNWFLKTGIGKVGREPLSAHSPKPQYPQKFQKTKFWQERIEGLPISSLHSIKRTASTSPKHQLFGFTYQQTMSDSQFRYEGNCFIPSLNSYLKRAGWFQKAEKIGQQLSLETPLSGVFGIDWLLNKQGLWPLEINPRPPASTELYSIATSLPLYMEHIGHCSTIKAESCNETQTIALDDKRMIGKRIVYNTAGVIKNAGKKLITFLESLSPVRRSGSCGPAVSKDVNSSGSDSNLEWPSQPVSMETVLEASPPFYQDGKCFPSAGSPNAENGTDNYTYLSAPVRFADIPTSDQSIHPGEPICTAILEFPIESKEDSHASSDEELYEEFQTRVWEFRQTGLAIEQKINAILND